MTGSNRAALAIMAQAPAPGKVKTRLQPHLMPQESADLYRALLLDTLDLASSIRVCDPFLVFAPPEEKAFFAKIVPPDFKLLPQTGGDLGTRMLDVFVQLSESGYSPVVLIGTDIPTLQPGHIEQAVECLHDSDLCLGPSTDGGYYLIGASKAHPFLFDGIPWSTGTVLNDTIEKARASNLSLTRLDAITDIDTVGDLAWLCAEIERLRQTDGAWIAPRTARYVEVMAR